MKKRLFFGLLVAILALGLVFVACDNGTPGAGESRLSNPPHLPL